MNLIGNTFKDQEKEKINFKIDKKLSRYMIILGNLHKITYFNEFSLKFKFDIVNIRFLRMVLDGTTSKLFLFRIISFYILLYYINDLNLRKL